MQRILVAAGGEKGMEGLSLERAAALGGLLFLEEELALFPCPCG